MWLWEAQELLGRLWFEFLHDGSRAVREKSLSYFIPYFQIRAHFVQQAELAGYETHNPWVSKAMQLYNLSQTYSTLIVAGIPRFT